MPFSSSRLASVVENKCYHSYPIPYQIDNKLKDVKKWKSLQLSQRYALEDKLSTFFPAEVKRIESRVYGYENDIARVKDNTILGADDFSTMVVEGVSYTEKKAAGTAILVACKAMTSPEPKFIGSYRGLDMELSFNNFEKESVLIFIRCLGSQ